MPRNRPRHTQVAQLKIIKTVRDAFSASYSDDTEAFDSMVLSMSPGEGVGVRKGKLTKIHFFPATRFGIPKIGKTPNW